MRLPVSNFSSLALIAMLGFSAPMASAETEPSRDLVLATVNGTDITLGHLIVLRAGLPQEYAQVEPQVLFEGILNQLVQQTLLAQSLDAEPSAQVRLMLENEERALLASEVINRVIEGSISEEAIQAMYEERYLTAEPKMEYSAAHILVETEEEAQAIIDRLDAGESFAALANDHSIGPTAPTGGDLGWFAEGRMVEPFFDAVAALDVGEVSGPVQTQFGWHVIQLNDTRMQERPELDATRAEIEETLRREALNAELERLESTAEVQRPDLSGLDAAVINDPSILER